VLFHRVLAVDIAQRSPAIQQKYSRVPYLNSSLFEISELEDVTIKINAINSGDVLPYIGSTILKEEKSKNEGLKTIDYLFRFLDAYDFASEGAGDAREDNKTLINASVLGKVFEKINGYKDGSIYTPGFITMYMARQSIRLAFVQKMNELMVGSGHENFKPMETLTDVYNQIGDRLPKSSVNEALNNLKICDPAVGSGHFLVSALNEIIATKSELNVLMDENGKTLRDYEIEIVNDELIITDENGGIFSYNQLSRESSRVQKTLFHEKQTIIENCLFGVDINPNSVKICRLRLWIELLKNAYYKPDGELETLPNIDINIKCGNSLLSRFALDADLSKALKSIKYDVTAYRGFVNDYKNCKDRELKRGLQLIIDRIKADFRTEIAKNDPLLLKLNKASNELYALLTQVELFDDAKIQKANKQRQEKLEADINKWTAEIAEIKDNAIYKNAFEWRFEFPEVLNNDGEFEGFDVVIGNPPYIRQEEIRDQKKYLQHNYKTYSGTADLYVFFVEKGFEILKSKGYFSYIISNKWIQAGYGMALRSFLLENQLLSVIDFGELQIFDSVTAYPCILNASKEKPAAKFQSVVIKSLQFDNGFEEYIRSNANELMMPENGEKNWMISSETEQILLGKITVNSKKLADYINGNSFRGLLTGLSEAFIIDTETRDSLIYEDRNSASLIKPFLLGRDLKPYASSVADKWLILIPKGFTIKRNLPPDSPFYWNEPSPRYGNMPYDEAWEWFKECYPAIARHLSPFKSKAKERTDKGDFWWELRACDYYEEFEKPKIMYQVLQVKPCFIYDDGKQYCNNSIWIIPKNDKFLVGILNSKMGWWLISKYCTAIQNGFQLIWKYFGQIPIPEISIDNKKPFVDLVDQIIKAKKQDKDSAAFEQQIDTLVYQLYDLTPDEIAIVEGSGISKANYEISQTDDV
jgi:hypothetical protein